MLAALVCALVLALAYPARTYLTQRRTISELEASTRAQEARIAALEARRRRATDPAHTEAEARRRLHFVRPGETAYIVIPPTPAPDPRLVRNGLTRVDNDSPWYSRLWSTVVVADQARPSSRR